MTENLSDRMCVFSSLLHWLLIVVLVNWRGVFELEADRLQWLLILVLVSRSNGSRPLELISDRVH